MVHPCCPFLSILRGLSLKKYHGFLDKASKNLYTVNYRAAGEIAVPCTCNPLQQGCCQTEGFLSVELPSISGVDVWVLRNRNL